MDEYQRPRGVGRFSMFPPVMKYLLLINIIVFLIDNLILNTFTINNIPIRNYVAYYFYLSGFDQHPFYYTFWQLITYQFFHADLWHLFFNMFALWMFGVEIEEQWGSRKFLIFYLLCGIGAGITQLFVTSGVTIGASGAVYGILLAFGLTFPNRPIFMFPIFIPIPAKIFVIIYAAIALLSGLSSTGDRIAHFAHLGGAATGLLLFYFGDRLGIYRLFSNKRRVTSGPGYNFNNSGRQTESSNVYRVDWEQPKPKPEQPKKTVSMNVQGEEITQAKIDAILDKISAGGYQSLTEKEKQILFELSQKLK